MRKAMNLIIDRQYIVDTIAQADQEVANTFIPTGMADGNGGEFRVNDDAYTYPMEDVVGYFDPNAYEENLEEARNKVYKNITKVHFDKIQYRTDIAKI